MSRPQKALNFYIFFAAIGIILTLIYSSTIIRDEFEHLRMSCLVSQGEVPYRDFFEHHHPLMWYFFAPIISALPHNFLLVFYAAKLLSFSFVCATYYIIYLIIKRFLGGISFVPYFFAMLFTFYPIWYGSSIFKPDVFARLFYFLGLYLFFCYLETQKIKNIIFCSISFTVAFLFLQTIVFSILPLIIPFGFCLYKNPRNIADCIKACLIPLAILGSCIALLFYTDAWREYYQLNWIFNKHLFHLMHPTSSSVFWSWVPQISFTFIYLFYQIRHHKLSFYHKIISLLFVCECINHILFPAVFAHYLILLFIFTSLILAPMFKTILTDIKYKSFRLYLYIYLFATLLLNSITLTLKNNQQILPIMQQINQTQSASIVNIDMNYVCIYAPKISYYSLFTDLHEIDDYLFHRFPQYNVNTLIQNTKPTYIDYEEGRKRFKQSKRFELSKDVLQDYKSVAPHLYQRKNTLP